MDEYLNQWLEVIENMSNDNTYKLAWGKAIVEVTSLYTLDNREEYIISFDELSYKMLKYYWNQTYFFSLEQGPNKKKRPIMLQLTEQAISYYQTQSESKIPVWFDKAEKVLKKDKVFFNKLIKDFSRTSRTNVCYRFLNANNKVYDLYKLDKKNMTITLTHDQIEVLKQFDYVLSQLLSYRWAQLLEQFNTSPRISNKVSGSSKNKIKRNNLTQYKNELLKEYDGKAIDFYTGEELKDNDISVDHVIPWSFMYSDDIWNLVLTSKSHNSSKSNNVPVKEVINRLKERNKRIKEKIDIKYQEDIEEAILNDYVDKFYTSLRL